ncbi:MAG TPA: aspartate-semialdehyde dehydrogenase [Terriglobales bacterium]|jgi:aspartate-semialdehyde dehydrogenase|nr:aspartate-semialdehyde dehydrogenase [Terriglobales bacterium]
MLPSKIPVGILGATGVVGQRFIQLLEHHPWFETAWLAASERSAGQTYQSAVRWRLRTQIPSAIASMKISPATPEGAPKLVFSALDTSVAAELEPRFAAAGHAIVSNSSAFRMQADVPLVIPEVNADHVRLLESQSWRREFSGFIVTNPNCSATGLVMALAPLHHRFGVEKVFVVTMQAISGAGYPGVPSLDILGNVIPYIAKEEEKMESESCKMLGRLNGTGIEPAAIQVSAHCNRVPVEDGHTESVSIKLKRPAKREEILQALSEFRGVPQELRLPNAPPAPIIVLESPDRPQPTLDVNMSAGMAVTIGRLRACPLLDWKFTVLSHNTIRGAAGAALLNAELLKAQGYL